MEDGIYTLFELLRSDEESQCLVEGIELLKGLLTTQETCAMLSASRQHQLQLFSDTIAAVGQRLSRFIHHLAPTDPGFAKVFDLANIVRMCCDPAEVSSESDIRVPMSALVFSRFRGSLSQTILYLQTLPASNETLKMLSQTPRRVFKQGARERMLMSDHHAREKARLHALIARCREEIFEERNTGDTNDLDDTYPEHEELMSFTSEYGLLEKRPDVHIPMIEEIVEDFAGVQKDQGGQDGPVEDEDGLEALRAKVDHDFKDDMEQESAFLQIPQGALSSASMATQADQCDIFYRFSLMLNIFDCMPSLLLFGRKTLPELLESPPFCEAVCMLTFLHTHIVPTLFSVLWVWRSKIRCYIIDTDSDYDENQLKELSSRLWSSSLVLYGHCLPSDYGCSLYFTSSTAPKETKETKETKERGPFHGFGEEIVAYHTRRPIDLPGIFGVHPEQDIVPRWQRTPFSKMRVSDVWQTWSAMAKVSPTLVMGNHVLVAVRCLTRRIGELVSMSGKTDVYNAVHYVVPDPESVREATVLSQSGKPVTNRDLYNIIFYRVDESFLVDCEGVLHPLLEAVWTALALGSVRMDERFHGRNRGGQDSRVSLVGQAGMMWQDIVRSLVVKDETRVVKHFEKNGWINSIMWHEYGLFCRRFGPSFVYENPSTIMARLRATHMERMTIPFRRRETLAHQWSSSCATLDEEIEWITGRWGENACADMGWFWRADWLLINSKGTSAHTERYDNLLFPPMTTRVRPTMENVEQELLESMRQRDKLSEKIKRSETLHLSRLRKQKPMQGSVAFLSKGEREALRDTSVQMYFDSDGVPRKDIIVMSDGMGGDNIYLDAATKLPIFGKTEAVLRAFEYQQRCKVGGIVYRSLEQFMFHYVLIDLSKILSIATSDHFDEEFQNFREEKAGNNDDGDGDGAGSSGKAPKNGLGSRYFEEIERRQKVAAAGMSGRETHASTGETEAQEDDILVSKAPRHLLQRPETDIVRLLNSMRDCIRKLSSSPPPPPSSSSSSSLSAMDKALSAMSTVSRAPARPPSLHQYMAIVKTRDLQLTVPSLFFLSHDDMAAGILSRYPYMTQHLVRSFDRLDIFWNLQTHPLGVRSLKMKQSRQDLLSACERVIRTGTRTPSESSKQGEEQRSLDEFQHLYDDLDCEASLSQDREETPSPSPPCSDTRLVVYTRPHDQSLEQENLSYYLSPLSSTGERLPSDSTDSMEVEPLSNQDPVFYSDPRVNRRHKRKKRKREPVTRETVLRRLREIKAHRDRVTGVSTQVDKSPKHSEQEKEMSLSDDSTRAEGRNRKKGKEGQERREEKEGGEEREKGEQKKEVKGKEQKNQEISHKLWTWMHRLCLLVRTLHSEWEMLSKYKAPTILSVMNSSPHILREMIPLRPGVVFHAGRYHAYDGVHSYRAHILIGDAISDIVDLAVVSRSEHLHILGLLVQDFCRWFPAGVPEIRKMVAESVEYCLWCIDAIFSSMVPPHIALALQRLRFGVSGVMAQTSENRNMSIQNRLDQTIELLFDTEANSLRKNTLAPSIYHDTMLILDESSHCKMAWDTSQTKEALGVLFGETPTQSGPDRPEPAPIPSVSTAPSFSLFR